MFEQTLCPVTDGAPQTPPVKWTQHCVLKVSGVYQRQANLCRFLQTNQTELSLWSKSTKMHFVFYSFWGWKMTWYVYSFLYSLPKENNYIRLWPFSSENCSLYTLPTTCANLMWLRQGLMHLLGNISFHFEASKEILLILDIVINIRHPNTGNVIQSSGRCKGRSWNAASQTWTELWWHFIVSKPPSFNQLCIASGVFRPMTSHRWQPQPICCLKEMSPRSWLIFSQVSARLQTK